MANWTKTSIVNELKTLPSWRKQFHTWPTPRVHVENIANRDLIAQTMRLSMSLGIAAFGTTNNTIDILTSILKSPVPSNHYFNKDWVQWTVSATPYHYGEDYLGMQGAADPYNWGEAHREEVNFYTNNLTNTLKYLKTRQLQLGLYNKVGLVFLDTEKNELHLNGDVTHDANVKSKFDVMYHLTKDICKNVLGYEVEVVWYGSNSVGLRNGNWTNSDNPSPAVLSDAGVVPLYYVEDSHLNVDLYNRSLALAESNNVKKMIPVVALGGGYTRNWQQWVNQDPNIYRYPYLNSWLMGRNIQLSPWLNNDECGKFEAAPYGIFWPGSVPGWKYWPLHFLAFAYGCSNVSKIPLDGDTIS